MGNLAQRIITGIILAPIVIALFYFLPHSFFFAFLCLVSFFALHEAALMGNIQKKTIFLFLCACGFLPLYLMQFDFYLLWMIISPLLYLCIRLLQGGGNEENINKEIMRSAFVIFLCDLFIILPLFSLYLIQGINRYLPLLFLFVIWGSDIGAYLIGRLWGKRPLAPMISPKKTFEGLLGSVAGSTVVFLALGPFVGFTYGNSFIIGIAMGLLGQFGDLFESMAKRVAGIKDSSTLIPGHGGILDRIDSFSFAAPFFYVCSILWRA